MRLLSDHPELSDEFESAVPAKRKEAALAVATTAVEMARLEDETVRTAIESLKTGSSPPENLRQVAEALDEAYLELHGRFIDNEMTDADSAAHYPAFDRARAAASVLAAAEGEPALAIYEALAIGDSTTEVQKLVTIARDNLRR